KTIASMKTTIHNSHQLTTTTCQRIKDLQGKSRPDGPAPEISLDRVKVRAPHHHVHLIGTDWRPVRDGYRRLIAKPFRVTLPNGDVLIRSDNKRQVIVEFNPSQLEHGHNLFCYNEPLHLPVLAIFEQLATRLSHYLEFRCLPSVYRGHVLHFAHRNWV